MALIKTVKHPFRKDADIVGAYVRMKDFAFNMLNGQGRVGFAVYKDKEARQADKKPYQLEQRDTDVIYAETEGLAVIAETGLKQLAITEINAHPELADLTKSDNGFINTFEDEFGESYTDALFSPALIGVDLLQKTVQIQIGVWASEADYLAGQPSIAGGLTFSINEQGFQPFVAKINSAIGKLYIEAKKNEKYTDTQDDV